MNKVALLVAFLEFLPGLALPAAPATPPIKGSLTLPFETVLPGVPFDMVVTLKNASKSTVSVGLGAKLVVTLPSGRTFAPDRYELLEQQPHTSEPMASAQLAPGETRQYIVPWQYAAVAWCHDGEYTAPGTYDLALQLSTGRPSSDYAGTVVTNTVHLKRAVPLGEDEALWRHMATAINGRWADDGLFNSVQGRTILKEILELHPTSAYYPYALLLEPLSKPRQASGEDIEKALDAAGRFSDSPAYPHLLLWPGEVALSLASDSIVERHSKTAMDYLTRADKFFNDALQKSSSVVVRNRAEFGLQRVHAEIESEHKRERSGGVLKN